MSTKTEIISPSTEITRPSVKSEEKQKLYLSNLIDNINLNNIGSSFYKDDNLFKKRLDKLNYKFYTETEKYLNDKKDMETSQDQLFIILFKQISLYIEETERLNHLLKDKDSEKHNNKDKEDVYKKERDKIANQQAMNYLKANNVNLEKKITEKSRIEEKMKKEFESLKRQLKFYKDKLQIELTVKKNNVSAKKKVSVLNTINYDDYNKIEKESYFKSNEKLVNNYKNDKIYEERLSSLKKDITAISDETERNFHAYDEYKEKTKSVIPPTYVNAKSPSKNFSLNLSSALKNKTTHNILTLQPKQLSSKKDVNISPSVKNKSSHGNLITIDRLSEEKVHEVYEFTKYLNTNIDAEMEELNELENNLKIIKNGFFLKKESKNEDLGKLNHSFDFNSSSPTNQKIRFSLKSGTLKTSSQAVTIDLNQKAIINSKNNQNNLPKNKQNK